jgi:SAM-dependent methyltransferase
MHQSAMFYAKAFFDVYCADGVPADFTVVEVGSQDVNGSLRAAAPDNVRYIGLDFAEGRGVDVVIDDPYEVPLPNDSADIVVTSSCFDHSEFFWLTFLEISRILKPGGFIYLNAPSNGSYHRYPVDCWRFYPDSGVALASWARRSGFEITLVESFIGNRSEEDIWNDFVAVFRKNNEQPWHKPNLIIDGIENYTNARVRSRLVNF